MFHVPCSTFHVGFASALLLGGLVLSGCSGQPEQGFQQVTTLAELDSLLEFEYPEEVEDESDPVRSIDSLDLLPGRIEPTYGDLPEILDRGYIRVLVSPSRTNYFVDDGIQRGFEYELMRRYEKTLDLRQEGRFVMVFRPVAFDRLLPDLVAGRGDIAAAGITVTPARRDSVSFTEPYLTGVSEIVVGRRRGPAIDSLADLSGRRVYVVRGSSYEQHLLELNEILKRSGRKPVSVFRARRFLEAEDLLELVDRGIIDFTVVDNHIAEFWSGLLPNLRPYPDAPLNEGGQIAWAVRSEDDALWHDLNTFAQLNRQGSLVGNVIFQRYFDDPKWAIAAEEPDEHLAHIRSLVQKYAEVYDFDWLLLAALAFQESKFDHSVTGPRGAIGLFQIKPAIAAAEPIGIDDVEDLENNIEAAVKYLDHIRDVYVNEPGIPDAARMDLVLASYNTGPNRIERLREKARVGGYDPNRWFGNVERFSGEVTVRFVANINRHYYALRLALHAHEEREEEMTGL